MFKIYMLAVIALIFVACGVEREPMVKSGMFQSVNSQDATLVQSGKEKTSCSRCGMNLVMFYKTSHKALHNNKPIQYCSIHCLEEHLGEETTLKNPQVVDVASLKFINVGDAYYVVGSKKRGTMSQVSKYAFLDKKMAKKFQDKYGGNIMHFNEALNVAKKDFR
ncbi:nitrous oxide reductase accessory protein NosL [Sulfurimonas sp.]|uniref:nitrous oxide reductase accessory protein NosL n=1 Tax=Sulfurimonas sp. TaxID=2022749 RepID=UPI002B46F55B|nr:nitrous oxide reductase accessory protein NosL [Sulfurimonas sp.]